MSTNIINLLCDQPHLLSATFDINGRAYQVMIDTGATISCLPEQGDVLKHTQSKMENANLVVELAGDKIEYINKKVKMNVKPTGSNAACHPAYFYVQKGTDIFGFQALIGLKHLKLFELQIEVKNGSIHI